MRGRAVCTVFKNPSPLCVPPHSRHGNGMRWLFQPLLLLVAKSTESELAKQVEYLKAENQILRKRLPRCLSLSLEDKRRQVDPADPTHFTLPCLVNGQPIATYDGLLTDDDKIVITKRLNP